MSRRQSGAVPRLTFALTIAPLVGLATLGISGVRGQTPPGDLPPPPGTLERELNAAPPPLPENSPDALGGGVNLAAPIEIPFILEGGHIIIDVSLDGAAPRPFIFDTGATHVMSPDVASTLSTSDVRDERLGGIGPRISQAEMVRVKRMTIGSAILEDQVVAVTELQNIILDRGSRPRLAGLIGSEMLAAYAVTIDYVHRRLTLNNPGFKRRRRFRCR